MSWPKEAARLILRHEPRRPQLQHLAILAAHTDHFLIALYHGDGVWSTEEGLHLLTFDERDEQEVALEGDEVLAHLVLRRVALGKGKLAGLELLEALGQVAHLGGYTPGHLRAVFAPRFHRFRVRELNLRDQAPANISWVSTRSIYENVIHIRVLQSTKIQSTKM